MGNSGELARGLRWAIMTAGARRVARQEKSVYTEEGTGGVARSLRKVQVKRARAATRRRLGNHREVVKVFCQSVSVRVEQREALGPGTATRMVAKHQEQRSTPLVKAAQTLGAYEVQSAQTDLPEADMNFCSVSR